MAKTLSDEVAEILEYFVKANVKVVPKGTGAAGGPNFPSVPKIGSIPPTSPISAIKPDQGNKPIPKKTKSGSGNGRGYVAMLLAVAALPDHHRVIGLGFRGQFCVIVLKRLAQQFPSGFFAESSRSLRQAWLKLIDKLCYISWARKPAVIKARFKDPSP